MSYQDEDVYNLPDKVSQSDSNERNKRYWEQPGGTYRNGEPNLPSGPTEETK